MKFIYTIFFIIGLSYIISLDAQTNVDVANAKVIDSFPYTETNISSTNGTTPSGMQGSCSTIGCCSTLVYQVVLPVDGSLYIEMDVSQALTSSIIAYTSNVANPTGYSDLTHYSEAGNFCGFRDTMQLGRGYIWYPDPIVPSFSPGWYDYNDVVPAGTYYILFFNINNQTTQTGGDTDLTFRFRPACDDTQPQPEIEVEGNGMTIPLADDTPSETDHTDLGTHISGGNPITRTYTIKNVSPTNALDISDVSISGTNASNFTVTPPSASTISGNGSTTFTVQFTPNTSETNTARVTVANSDCDKAAYSFDLEAFVLAVPPSDVRGNMITLNGTGDYVEINDVAEKMVGVESFTIETWFNADATQVGNDRLVCVNKSNGDNRLLFYLDDGILETYVASSGNVYTNAAVYTNLRDDLWHHVAFTHDGSTNSNTIYLDGQLVETETRAVTDFLATDQWSIGQEFDGGSAGDFFKGKFDEVRIWKDVRDINEIREKMHLTFSIEDIRGMDNLVAYYQFDNDEAVTTVDGVKDVLGNHGTTIGGTYSASEVAVGGGKSALVSIYNGDQVFAFPETDIELYFSNGNDPQGDVVVTKIMTEKPYSSSLNEMTYTPDYYWVIRNYGTSNVDGDVKFKFQNGEIVDDINANHTVHKRGSNEYQAADWNDLTPFQVLVANNQIRVAISNFSQFSLSSNTSEFVPSVLPVELLDFTAKRLDKTVQLNWETASETNNQGFQIERMNHSTKAFESIGWTTGNGTTSNISYYQFTDRAPNGGTNYYRLKQIDWDGRFEYSDIVNLTFAENTKIVSIFPNPVHHELNIINGEGIATIYNLLGEQIRQFIINDTQVNISVNDLINGHYLLHIQQENGDVVTKRFVK